MSVQDERMWAEVLEAHTPNAAEMAEAEAGLQALGDAPPLPAEDVEELVQLATKTPLVTLESRGVVGTVSRARRFRQPILQAAAAVMFLMAVAWVARQFVWTEGVDSYYTLPYARAVDLATQSGRSDDAYRSALSRIVSECYYAAQKLRYLADQPANPLADQAKHVSAELIKVLKDGDRAPYVPIRASLEEFATKCADENLTVEARRNALDQIRELAKIGLTAVMLAELEGDEARQHRTNWINKLLRTLPRAD